MLTLNRPQAGNVVIFDTHDYAIIDFRLITNQWIALVPIGGMLRIVFRDGAVIELLNFFSSGLADDLSNGNNHTGTTPDAFASSDVLVRTTDTEFLSPAEFSRSYWVTKPSGTIVLLSISQGGSQVLGIEPGQLSPDVVPLSFPLDPLSSGFRAPLIPGLELPLPSSPLPPSPFPLPPAPTVNSDPFISAAVANGNTTEDATPPAASGTIEFGDAEIGDVHVVSVVPGGPGYVGTFTASVSDEATGGAAGEVTWTYSSDPAELQYLAEGQQLVQIYTVTIDDGQGGTVSQVVTITITGANDAAVITGDTAGVTVEAGGVANAIPGIPTANGDLDAADVDGPADSWIAVGTPTVSASGYGSFMMTAAGVWSYTLDDSNAAVHALNVGGTLTDSFTALTADGTAQLVTITIDGANDAATISGDAAGATLEASSPGIPVDSGDLFADDVDNPDDTWNAVVAPTLSANGYGSFTLTAAGVWTYTLDNSNAAVQALNVGGMLSDSFTALTADGTAQLVTITIDGANDAATLNGDAAGAVTEAGGVNNGTAGVAADSGDLNAADVDNPNDTWNAVAAPTLSANGYGSFTLTAAGVFLHGQQRPCHGACAQRRQHAGGQLHGHHHRWYPAGGLHHHHRRQRRAGGDRGGGQRRGDGRLAAGDDGGGHDRLR